MTPGSRPPRKSRPASPSQNCERFRAVLTCLQPVPQGTPFIPRHCKPTNQKSSSSGLRSLRVNFGFGVFFCTLLKCWKRTKHTPALALAARNAWDCLSGGEPALLPTCLPTEQPSRSTDRPGQTRRPAIPQCPPFKIYFPAIYPLITNNLPPLLLPEHHKSYHPKCIL